MRLDHLLSKEEEVGKRNYCLIMSALVACKKHVKNRTQNLSVAMRLGETPVPIPNTMVKPQAADGTALETVWESRWLPN